MTENSRVNVYPVLPLRDIVVFPHMIVPLFVGRDKSVRALEDVMQDDKQILLVAQKNAGQDDPTHEDIHEVGTIGTVLQLLKLPDGTVKVLVEGSKRRKLGRLSEIDLEKLKAKIYMLLTKRPHLGIHLVDEADTGALHAPGIYKRKMTKFARHL